MTHILFVDDEPRILQGLRQSLWAKRKVWQMAFVESGVDALAHLERTQCQAVVSDMRMPGMDGSELLRRVRIIQPDAFRVVLSGQMDESAAVRAAATAHRFLAKPCDPALLLSTLTYGVELQAQLASEGMRACVGGASELPSPPATARALNRALEDEFMTLQDITSIVERDAAVAVKVLKLVNSAYFGLGRRVVSIEQAVRQLGLRSLRSLVMAHALFQELAGPNAPLLEQEQARSLMAAQYARRFRLSSRESEVASTAALLHNVGTLVLMLRAPDAFRSALEHAAEHHVSMAEAERAVIGVTHAEVGAYLLRLWGLPEEVVEAVGVHHRPLDELQVLDAGAVVRIVEELATGAVSGSHAGATLPEAALQQLGVFEVVQAISQERLAAAPRSV